MAFETPIRSSTTTGQSLSTSVDVLRLVSRHKSGRMMEDHGLSTIGLRVDSTGKTIAEELRNHLGPRVMEGGMITRKVRGMIRSRRKRRIFGNMNSANITSLELVSR